MITLVTRRSFPAGSLARLAAPLASEAQPAGMIHRIGFLHPSSPSSTVDSGYAKIFQQDLPRWAISTGRTSRSTIAGGKVTPDGCWRRLPI